MGEMVSRDASEWVADGASERVPSDADASTLDEATLERFIAEHYDRLLRLAWLVTRDATLTADAVQTGLEQAWRHRSRLRDAEKLRGWLDRIVVREAIRVTRRRRSWLQRLVSPDHEEAWIEMGPVARGPSAEWVAFRAAFGSLPLEQRAAIVLHLYAGYTVAETAQLVGARVGTIRSRLRLARARLRNELGEREQ